MKNYLKYEFTNEELKNILNNNLDTKPEYIKVLFIFKCIFRIIEMFLKIETYIILFITFVAIFKNINIATMQCSKNCLTNIIIIFLIRIIDNTLLSYKKYI